MTGQQIPPQSDRSERSFTSGFELIDTAVSRREDVSLMLFFYFSSHCDAKDA